MNCVISSWFKEDGWKRASLEAGCDNHVWVVNYDDVLLEKKSHRLDMKIVLSL